MPELIPLNSKVPREQLEMSVRQAVARAMGLGMEEVKLSSSLQHDLGAESLDYLDIAFTLEREHKVHFPREDLLQRAGQHFGEDNLVKEGVVSELGLRMLKQAMPEIDSAQIKSGLRASQVPGLFTVQTFVRVLDRLLFAKEQMPRACPKCGTEMGDSTSLPELVCPGCQTSVPVPSGDNVMFDELVRMSQQGEKPL